VAHAFEAATGWGKTAPALLASPPRPADRAGPAQG